MLWNELKRIFTKLPILILFIIILPVFATSSIIIGIRAPTAPSELSDEEIIALETRLNNIRDIIEFEVDDFAPELLKAFDDFTDTWDPFFNHSNINDFRDSFETLRQAYINFAKAVETGLGGGASIVLITGNNYNTLRRGMDEFERILITPNYDAQALNYNILYEIRSALGRADNHVEDIRRILYNTHSIVFDDDEILELAEILFYRVIPYLDAATSPDRYGHSLAVACEYLELNIMLIQARHTNNITRFQGFSDFNQYVTRDRIAILSVLINENKIESDFSTPFHFNQVLHAQTGTTGMDFVFNNLELVSIPLIILACLIVVFCIFDDIKKNTIIGSLVGPQSRRKVITAKLLACTITIAFAIGIFGFLFFMTAMIITGTVTAPTILTAFGGAAIKISPFLLLLIYLISLFFKVLFFASITALFCINAKSLKSVLIKSGIIIGVIILLNAFLSVVWPLVFYQYLPLIALDFAGFFGIGFMLSGHLASTFIWFTLPIMLIIWGAIITATILKFNKRDF